MRARTSGTTRRKRPPMKESRVALTRAEKALLLQACRRYKDNLPIYLQAAREELKLIKTLLRKLG